MTSSVRFSGREVSERRQRFRLHPHLQVLPRAGRYEGNRFFWRQEGRLRATPLFITLLAVESSGILFAVDSIPAIFAITSDPFIVYTSNIFAMLGLRALYFAVSGFMQMFHFLHYGFASIILILGVKMLLSENIIDMGERKVRDAMRRRRGGRVIRLDLPWEENLKSIRETRFSRYPRVEHEDTRPVGVLHVKNIPFAEPPGGMTLERLKALARALLEMPEELPLEEALGQFQRRFRKMAIVLD